ncbi:MAG: adenylate/guanylate cyclase domain-containing protein [Spirochaetes bacterium]|nr:adenylate/guanylate cyclase domain-containing protein [Spirochaetota bacterium]
MSIFKKDDSGPVDIRKIRFGLKLKFSLILSVIMITVISILSVVMYLNQKNLLEQERNTKASILTHILSGHAEYYLDKTVKTADKELELKYRTIRTEALNYKNFNDDIEKIILTDETGRVKFSTENADYKRKDIFPYIKKSLGQQKEELEFYDFSERVSSGAVAKKQKPSDGNFFKKIINLFSKDEKKINTLSLRAITYPIFLHKGNVIELLDDFKKNYRKYHESNPIVKNKIYDTLLKKYEDTLSDEFKREVIRKRPVSKKITKAGDIDFLFHELFGNIMILRDRRVNRDERWMFRDAWLIAEKRNKENAYLKDNPAKAKGINDLIISRMETIAAKVEGVRRLGTIAIIFNIDKINAELDRTIDRVSLFALIMIIVCLIAFRFVLVFMIRNLKKLEKWAGSVSEGNLDTKIVINTNDEIGRLGDIFNNMIDQVAIKYHLEKFLSSSAISMIRRKSDSAAELQLGGTERRNLVFLFSDVRGFTSFSEKNDPSIVMEVLSHYLDLQSNVIIPNKGDIDSYIGDEIMAHFRGENNVERAIDSAIGIMKAIAKENALRQKERRPIFEVGIGIHGGDVVVGNIGTKTRMVFTCIGDAVNLSARLCSNAGAGEILISKSIYDRSKKKYSGINSAPISVKGKDKPINIVKIKV